MIKFSYSESNENNMDLESDNKKDNNIIKHTDNSKNKNDFDNFVVLSNIMRLEPLIDEN